MMRLRAVVLVRDERTVLRGLGELGVIQLVRTKAGPDTAPLAPPDYAPERARGEALRTRVAELRRRLEISPPPGIRSEFKILTLAEIEEALLVLEQHAGGLIKKRDALQNQWGQVAALVEQMETYRSAEIPFDQLDESSFLHFAIGRMPEGNLDALREKTGDNVVLLPLPGDANALVAITSRKGRYALDTALQQTGFQREKVSVPEGQTPALIAEEGGKEQARLAAELKQVQSELAGLAESTAPVLTEMDRAVDTELRMLAAQESFPHTAATVLMTGWVPAAELPSVEQRLKQLTGGRCVIESTPPGGVPDGEIPVLLRHPRLLRPFEMLTTGYGVPGYRELEPTLFVAITFVLMFGMMFGDTGHGAVLVLGGLAAWLTGHVRKVRDLGILIMLAGASSMVFGLVYGSFFGLERFKKYALWHDPLEGDPMSLMGAAIGVGVLIISLGLILNMINRFRKRDFAGGFLDKFGVAGALFYWGVLALLLKYAALKRSGLSGMALILVVALPLTVWVLKEPVAYVLKSRRGPAGAHSGSFFEAVMESCVEAFEAVLGYMANTISFVRLAAYAMSHAAILMATFVMAAEVKKAAGGGVLSVLVIIAGNLIAILLEGIIAAVQTLRLEYYEFFGKFFSGDGHPFMPFRLGAADEKQTDRRSKAGAAVPRGKQGKEDQYEKTL
jgi:V/A-type H+-transporting ATPase subunit I